MLREAFFFINYTILNAKYYKMAIYCLQDNIA